jgi:hypothetical protein
MKHRKLTFVLAALALLAGSGLAQAQGNQGKLAADIGFKFWAGSRAMAPAKYNIVLGSNGEITIRDVTGKASDAAGKSGAVLIPITTLGRHDTNSMPGLVFDQLPDGPHLSEVWFPGVDGMLLLATKEPHKHLVLPMK